MNADMPPLVSAWGLHLDATTLASLRPDARCLARPEELLTALLVRYWRGGVTQEVAAKFVGMRKEEFAELAALRRCVMILEDLAWRYYLARFNYQFPECDRTATKRESPDWKRSGGRRMFTDSELLSPPQFKTMREVISGTENRPRPVKWDLGNGRPPADIPPVLATEKDQQPIQWCDVMSSHAEFEFSV